jgi:restriction endonuclease
MDRVTVVNETGLRLMEMLRCDQQASLDELVAQLHVEFDASAQQIMSDVAQYLETLEQEGIIERVP